MKKRILFPLFFALFWVACQAETPDTDLAKKVASLEAELNKVKTVLKKAARLDIDAMYLQIKEQEEAEKRVQDIPVGKSPIIGPKDAAIKIVEFSDFQCPYCAKRAEEVKAIQEKYPTKVSVTFKHFPLSFHKKAPAAHAASIAAQKQGKFFPFRYALAPAYRDLSEASFIKAAQTAGLDVEQFKKDMALTKDKQDWLDEDMALGAKIGVRGTPTFFVNGKLSRSLSMGSIGEMISKLK